MTARVIVCAGVSSSARKHLVINGMKILPLEALGGDRPKRIYTSTNTRKVMKSPIEDNSSQSNGSIWLTKAKEASDRRDYGEAIKNFDKALKLEPTNPIIWFNKGITLEKFGRHTVALNAFDEAIKLDPNFSDAYVIKGNLLARNNEPEMAIRQYDRAIETYPENDPKLARAWYNKGLALAKSGKYKEALEAFDKSISINPRDEKAWYGKYSALSSLGLHSEANDALIRGKTLDRIRFEQRINEINEIIDKWRPFPSSTPPVFVDPESFVAGHDAHLAKIGDQIKIRTTNVGDIDITYDDLRGDSGRIGISFEFLDLLKNRLSAFKKELDEVAGRTTQK